MCQDNIKIRAEGDLDNESVQNVLKQPLIIRKVFESLDFTSLLHCRIVSKSWEKEATFIMAKKCKVTFKDIESVQDFVKSYPEGKSNSDAVSSAVVDLSLFAHVTFQFDVEGEAKKKPAPESLQFFLRNHVKQLINVETPAGQMNGAESISEWAEKLLEDMSADNDKPENVESAKKSDPMITDDNNNEVIIKPEESDDEPAVLNANSNYASEIIECDIKSPSDLDLQEIIIHDHDDEIKKEIDLDAKSKSLASVEKSRKSVHFSMVDNPDYVPIPYCEEGYNSFADFYPYYLGEHSHETARRLHILGITNSIILIIIGTFTLTPILYAVAILQAYALAVGAHCYFERHIPRPTIRNPIYMIMGIFKMWWEVASGQRPL